MTPKKIAAFALGPLGGALLGFITLPIITWYFSQEDIGRLAMLSVVTSFCTLLFSLGLDQAYVREFHETASKIVLLKTTLLPGLFLMLITLSVLLSMNGMISQWLFGIDSLLLSVLTAVIILSTFISRFLSLILRMNEQGFAYSMSQLIPKLLLIAVICGYVLFSVKKSIVNLVLANVVAILFVSVVFGWNTRKEWLAGLGGEIDYKYLKSLLKFGTPLIFGGLAFWGLTATDKILLKELSDFEQLGLYSVAVSFAAVAYIFKNVFTTIWAPMVYKWAAAGKGLENIYKVNRYVLLVVITLFSLAGLFSWIVTLILPENYDSVRWILIPCLGFPLLYTLSETTVVGLGITRRSGLSIVAALFAFLVNVIGGWYMIPSWGASGAAASTCVAFWLFLVLRTELSIYAWKPMPRLALYSYTSLLVIGSIINGLYGERYQNQLIIFWLIILMSTFIFFRVEIKEIKNWLLAKANRT